MIIVLLLLHGAVALAAAVLGRRLGRRVFLLTALAPAAALIWAIAAVLSADPAAPVVTELEWVPALGLTLSFRLDTFSLVMAIVVSGVGVLVMVFAYGYFSSRTGLGFFAAMLLGFAAAMLGLVTADNLLLLFVFWELTSITSYLLIGFEDEKAAARSAALQALLVTGIGGLVLLAGLVVLAQEAGTYSLSALLAEPPAGVATNIGLGLVLFGAFTKSAQVPFHFWLPGAMAAPTPVSAYLHSATMVKAGVYLVARFSPAFGDVAFWRPLVVGIGLATMLIGGYRAMHQRDLKLLLAYGTVSQLGFMVVLFSLGGSDATLAGVALLVAHTLFKAALFMVAGIVDRQAHTRDLADLGGLGRVMPATAAVAAVAAASMAGVPLLLGFVAKEVAVDGLLASGNILALVGIAAGSVFTVAYSVRFVWGTFGGAPPPRDGDEPRTVARPAGVFLAPAAVLALLTVLWGVVPGQIGAVVVDASVALDPVLPGLKLKAWPGFGTPVLVSTLILAGGLVLYAGRGLLAAAGRWTGRVPDAGAAYQWALRTLNRVADRVTAVAQPGSLPFYGGVILTTAVVLPGWYLVRVWRAPLDLAVAEGAVQAVVAVIVAAAAIGILFAPRRVGAVLLLGAVGYGVALLFVIQGAPDLALTQMLIETLTLVVFILVLRHLPERFSPARWRLQRLTRVAVAGGLGLFVAVFTLFAASSRVGAPISTEMITRALPEGGGRNVVNVILTDFRALDTLGEITVLAVAALGILSLVRTTVNRSDLEEVDD